MKTSDKCYEEVITLSTTSVSYAVCNTVFCLRGDEPKDYLLLGQWSRHHEQGNLYNQTHGLVGFERNNYSIGYYTNSYNDPSWFVGYSQKYTPDSLPFVQFKLNYVAVTGYSIPIVPVIAPSVTLGKGLVQMEVRYIPMVATTVGFRISLPNLK